MSIFGALERQWFIRELPVLADGVNQIGDGILAILEGFANGVLNQGRSSSWPAAVSRYLPYL
jgi:hypothetical protein